MASTARHSRYAPEVVPQHSDLEVEYAEHFHHPYAEVPISDIPLQTIDPFATPRDSQNTNPFADPDPVSPIEEPTTRARHDSFTNISMQDELPKTKPVPKKSGWRSRKFFCCFCSPKTFCIVSLVLFVIMVLSIVFAATMVKLPRGNGRGDYPITPSTNGTRLNNSTQLGQNASSTISAAAQAIASMDAGLKTRTSESVPSVTSFGGGNGDGPAATNFEEAAAKITTVASKESAVSVTSSFTA
jgi:hypothetical protein